MTSPAAAPAVGFVRSRLGGLPRAFWVLWTGSLVNRLGTMVLPFLSLYLTSGRQLSVATAGEILALLGVGQMFSQLIGGVLADRFGRRVALTGGMVGTGAVMIGLGYVESLALIAAFALLLGLVVDMFRPAVQAIVADMVPDGDRPRAFGLLIWAINIGFSVAMVLGGTLAGAGFHTLFWVDALTCVAFGLLVWRAVPETRVAVRERDRGGFAEVLRDRVMLGFLVVVLAAAFVFLQCLSTLPLAMRSNGLPPSAYGIVMAVNGIVIVLVQPLLGNRLGRWDHSWVLAGGIVVLGLGFGATALAGGTPAYAATVAVWTLGEIVFHSMAATVVNDLAPAHLRGRYNGAYGTAWGVAAFVAPLGGTMLLSVGAPVLWSTCLVVCLLAAAGQLVLAPAARRRRNAGES
ncbi:MDR family MFS transporter [Kutzneria kofuensis]|uniref:MFS family permease n=1 Tax=Kutzneria kofuensis TaxID=103725 RepID=A0A7W9KBZ9_9PSEU|nr:MFS transporter [Kutzneria kofuensis]MBB5889398.1 MFS family permease [Kutzneria kofuensis]